DISDVTPTPEPDESTHHLVYQMPPNEKADAPPFFADQAHDAAQEAEIRELRDVAARQIRALREEERLKKEAKEREEAKNAEWQWPSGSSARATAWSSSGAAARDGPASARSARSSDRDIDDNASDASSTDTRSSIRPVPPPLDAQGEPYARRYHFGRGNA